MSKLHVAGLSAAVVAACVVAAGAQVPATQTAPDATAKKPVGILTVTGCLQPQRAAQAAAPSTSAQGQPAMAVGTGDEFVLTNVTFGAAPETASAGATGTTGATGTGSVAAGTSGTAGAPAAGAAVGTSGAGGLVYDLTGDKEADLKPYVGQRIEIKGRLETAAPSDAIGAAAATAPPATAAAGAPTGATAAPAAAAPSAAAGGMKRLSIDSFRALNQPCTPDPK